MASTSTTTATGTTGTTEQKKPKTKKVTKKKKAVMDKFPDGCTVVLYHPSIDDDMLAFDGIKAKVEGQPKFKDSEFYLNVTMLEGKYKGQKESIAEKELIQFEKLTLSSKPAINFWNKHFKDQESVKNKVFKAALTEYFNEKKDKEEYQKICKSKNSAEVFAGFIVQQILWPRRYASGPGFDPKITQDCLEAAMNCWGPFTKMFVNIHQNLQSETLAPIHYFHGRVNEEQVEVLLENLGDYLLRYDPYDSRYLLLSWVKRQNGDQATRKHERIRRFKPKGKDVVWRWESKVADVTGPIQKNKDFEDLHAILADFKKGANPKLIEPIIFNSVYDSVQQNSYGEDGDDEKAAETKKNLDDAIEKMMQI